MEEINNYLESHFQMDKPIKNLSYQEIKEIILKEINPKNPKKAPEYDLITGSENFPNSETFPKNGKWPR